MKNYLKFIVAVFGITIATFGTVSSKAKVITGSGKCLNSGNCGTADNGALITGTYYN